MAWRLKKGEECEGTGSRSAGMLTWVRGDRRGVAVEDTKRESERLRLWVTTGHQVALGVS